MHSLIGGTGEPFHSPSEMGGSFFKMFFCLGNEKQYQSFFKYFIKEDKEVGVGVGYGFAGIDLDKLLDYSSQDLMGPFSGSAEAGVQPWHQAETDRPAQGTAQGQTCDGLRRETPGCEDAPQEHGDRT